MKKLLFISVLSVIVLGSVASAKFSAVTSCGEQLVWIIAGPYAEWVAYTKEAMHAVVDIEERRIAPIPYDPYNPNAYVRITKETWHVCLPVQEQYTVLTINN